MSKKPKMRWSKSDRQRLQQITKKFNQKIAYHEKRHPDYILPNKRSAKELRGGIETRKDFNRLIKSMERFLERGAEKPHTNKKGLTRSQWEFDEAKRKDIAERKKTTREHNKVKQKEVTTRGKPTGLKRAETGSVKEAGVQRNPADLENMKEREFERFVQAVEKRLRDNYFTERDKAYKENYITALIRCNYPDEIIEMCKRIPDHTLVEVAQTDPEAEITFIYDPIEMQIKIDAIKKVWSKYVV